jgi:hypothetical protein
MTLHHDALSELMAQIESQSIKWTNSGIDLSSSSTFSVDPSSPSQRRRGGNVINRRLIQHLAISKALESLGDDAWLYSFKSGNRRNLARILPEVQEASGYSKLNIRTFRNWLQFYLKYGLIEEDWKRIKKSLRKKYGPVSRTFSREDSCELSRILEEDPDLYLDEIQSQLYSSRGKLFKTSTLWTQMKNLGYVLKVAVFRAIQQSEVEREMYFHRLEDAISNINQVVIIDETQKSRNASRRRRGWVRRGHQLVLDREFEEDFKVRYTLVGACDVHGFITDACRMIERERDRRKNKRNRFLI